ncbi:hypothetical protein HPP92_024945 [Vanilla planifolia]|uniref:Piezo-type mechanosensitive ion channel homolog domain-containing protein n=1 Tax=Vanilla planifolia TaxID=51239 RepID=A0A835UBU8_VANPL|nr:hypothetical protein HPP92_024945 [Vanilla planifolia]
MDWIFRERFLGGFVLPLVLLTVSLLYWSLISLVNLFIFFAIQLTNHRPGFLAWRQCISHFTIIFSLLTIFAQVVFDTIWCIKGNGWVVASASWPKLIGFVRIQAWGSSTSIFYSMTLQFAAALFAYLDVHHSFSLTHWNSCRLNFLSAVECIGSYLRIGCCILLPLVQLILGISHPSWLSLPYFICSCVGLLKWSLTSKFLGLLCWWRYLRAFACFNILLLYIYQLPCEFPKLALKLADFIGLYKLTITTGSTQAVSACFLLMFYCMLSFVNFDLEEMDFIMSTEDNGVTEQLLPSKCSVLSQASRSMIRSTNVLLRESIFKRSSVNFFTYGFPVLLLALSFWCFYFASICAFVLLAYVGYVFYAFPSLFDLQWLNGLLLAFVLLWTICTYVFNVAFTFLNGELGEDMAIWDTIGLWRYPIPGFFLLAQFFLGVLIAIRNLVDNSVSVYLSDVDRGSSNDGFFVEEEEDAKVLVVATIAWGLRKSPRAIALALIFHLALKPGLLHAIYIIFFLLYLLSHSVRRKIQRTLVLFCEMHFSLLYVLRLKLIAHALEQTGSLTMWILSLLGLSSGASFIDLLEIGALLCFSAVQIYGSKVLFSFSAIVQHTPVPPFGFSVLKAGLDKSVLLSVYTSPSSTDCQLKSSKVLLNVYLMNPNYVSLGY